MCDFLLYFLNSSEMHFSNFPHCSYSLFF